MNNLIFNTFKKFYYVCLDNSLIFSEIKESYKET